MDHKRRALGRGLGALIPVGEETKQYTIDQNNIPISAILPNPFQPRDIDNDSGIEKLAESIRRRGILQPLLVRQMPDGYELIAGERRLRAAQRAGLTSVPVVLREATDDELLEIALIENLQREDLNPIEEARAYKRLIDEFGLTRDQIAERVSKDRSTVANALRLLQLPTEIQGQIGRGHLSAGHARSLLGVGSTDEQLAVAREVVTRRLSVRETERLARKRQQGSADADHRAIEEQLSRSMGTRVQLHIRRNGHGKIEIQFYSLAELNGLLDRLTGQQRTAISF